MKWNRANTPRLFGDAVFPDWISLHWIYISTVPVCVNTAKVTFIDRPARVRLEFYRKLFLRFEAVFSHRGMPGDIVLSERRPWKK